MTGAGPGAQPVDLPMPRVGPVGEHAPKPIRVVLNWGRRYSLWVFNFGLACCAIEFIASSMGRHDFIRLGVIPFAPGPRQADLMVVSGTVTDKMAPAIRHVQSSAQWRCPRLDRPAPTESMSPKVTDATPPRTRAAI
jgi:hypothetical protein